MAESRLENAMPAPANSTTIMSLEAFDDMLELYGGVLSLCSIVALINHHRVKFPLPISLSLSGLLMSIVLVCIDALLAEHPIRSMVSTLLMATDFDEIILRFGIGFLMFAAAMESDINALRPHWGLVFLLSACGVLISVVMCAAASLAIFLGFGYYASPPTVVEILYCVLFGAVVSPTDAHHFVLKALETSGAPESFAAIVVGEGLTNDALSVVVFSIVKTFVDSKYLESHGGCKHISNEAECDVLHMCEWEEAEHGLNSSLNYGVCIDGHGELDVWEEIAKDIFGGVFLGIFFGWVFSLIMRRVRQPNINILLSITLVIDVIAVSNLLGSSAAIACASAGLFLRAFGLSKLERQSQEQLDIVWNFFEEGLSGMFFLFIGLAIITDDFSVDIFFASVIAIPVSLGARWLSVAVPIYLWNYFSDEEPEQGNLDTGFGTSVIKGGEKIPWTIVPTLTWGGIRGGSSVALALSLSPYEGRTHIFAMVYAVVLHSLIVQGLSLPRFLKGLFVEHSDNSGGSADDNEREAWIAAERGGLLADISEALDKSPLLAQMLEEEGIRKEHLEALSDASNSVSSSHRDVPSQHSHTSGGNGGNLSYPVSPAGSYHVPSPPNSYNGDMSYLPPRHQSPRGSHAPASGVRFHSSPSLPRIDHTKDSLHDKMYQSRDSDVAVHLRKPSNITGSSSGGDGISSEQRYHNSYRAKPSQHQGNSNPHWERIRYGIRDGTTFNKMAERATDDKDGRVMRSYAASNSSGDSFPSGKGPDSSFSSHNSPGKPALPASANGRKGKNKNRRNRRRRSKNKN